MGSTHSISRIQGILADEEKSFVLFTPEFDPSSLRTESAFLPFLSTSELQFNSHIFDNVNSSTIIFTSSHPSLESHSAQANLKVCKHQDILVQRVSHCERSKDTRIPRQISVARHVFVNHVSCARFHEAQQAQC